MPGVKRGRGLVGGNVKEALFEDRAAVDPLVDPEERARGDRLVVQYGPGHRRTPAQPGHGGGMIAEQAAGEQRGGERRRGGEGTGGGGRGEAGGWAWH